MVMVMVIAMCFNDKKPRFLSLVYRHLLATVATGGAGAADGGGRSGQQRGIIASDDEREVRVAVRVRFQRRAQDLLRMLECTPYLRQQVAILAHILVWLAWIVDRQQARPTPAGPSSSPS